MRKRTTGFPRGVRHMARVSASRPGPTPVCDPGRARPRLPDPRASFRAGLRVGVPFAVAGGLLSLSFGVIARDAGFSALAAITMSLIVFAGSAQFASVAILAAGGNPAAAIAAASLMNSRFLPMGAALAPSLPGGDGSAPRKVRPSSIPRGRSRSDLWLVRPLEAVRHHGSAVHHVAARNDDRRVRGRPDRRCRPMGPRRDLSRVLRGHLDPGAPKSRPGRGGARWRSHRVGTRVVHPRPVFPCSWPASPPCRGLRRRSAP